MQAAPGDGTSVPVTAGSGDHLMDVSIRKTWSPEVVILEHTPHDDEHGFFKEIFRSRKFRELGLPESFAQVNVARSARSVVSGLHFQWSPPMGELMRVTDGAAFLVAVDIRRGSDSLGKWVGEIFSAEDHAQLWAPAGFARGFCVVSESALIESLCTVERNPAAESVIRWNDRRLGIRWPVAEPALSERDASAGTLDEWLARPESNTIWEPPPALAGKARRRRFWKRSG